MKTEKQYVCIRCVNDNAEVILIPNEEMLVKSFNSNLRRDTDRYYELGPEVKIKTTVETVKNDVYRDRPYPKGII